MSADGSPRQKMIGMMYLVLTALLALNVSKEIINAFVVINKGVETSNIAFDAKNTSTMNSFQKAYKDNPAKYKKYYDTAVQAKAKCDTVYKYIQKTKALMMAKVQGIDEAQADTLQIEEVDVKDNYDIPTEMLIGSEIDSPKDEEYSAKRIKKKLTELKKELQAMMAGVGIKDVNLTINTPDRMLSAEGDSISWEAGQFYHTPVSASVAILSKIQGDIKNSESECIKALYSQVTAEDFKVNQITAIPIYSSVIMQNSDNKAKIMLAAYDDTQTPEVYVGADAKDRENPDPTKKLEVENGAGIFKMPAGSVGPQKIGGYLRVKGPTGAFKQYDFEMEYDVAAPSATVAATKMNVLYVGVDNPLSVSVPGVSPDKIKISPTNCTLKSEGKGLYTARVTTPGQTAVISVTADINGKPQPMGKQEFRIKGVPDPVPAMGKKKGSFAISKSEFLAQSGIQAELENFAFDLKFDVISFDISAKVGEFIVTKSASGNKFNEDMKQVFTKLSKGTKVYVENVKAKGPDGTVRTLGAMSITINSN